MGQRSDSPKHVTTHWDIFITLSIKIDQKLYIIGSLGPKALKYESFDAKGNGLLYHVHATTHWENVVVLVRCPKGPRAQHSYILRNTNLHNYLTP